MTRVLLAFADLDRAMALRLAGDLADAGLGISLATDATTIDLSADFVVMCLSSAAARSHTVQHVVEQARERGVPMIPVILEPAYEAIHQQEGLAWLLEKPLIHFDALYQTGLSKLLKTLASERLFLDMPNPYVGSRPFYEMDAPFFFGRDDVVRQALQRLRQTAALTIVGARGSGKSSLIRAGVLPLVRDGAIRGSDHWLIVSMVADAHPLETLAHRLYPLLDDTMTLTSLMADLRTPAQVLSIFEAIHQQQAMPTRLLLIIDQLEAIFAQTSETERHQFLDVLRIITAFETSQTSLMLALQSEFFTQVQSYPELAKLFEQDHLLVLPEMRDTDLRDAIERPLHVINKNIEPTLVMQLMQDAHSLPYLQTILHDLFSQSTGTLTQAGYATLTGGFSRRAEIFYADLSEHEQHTLKQVLLSLIDISEDGAILPRTIPQEILSGRDIEATFIERVAHETGMLLLSQVVRDDALQTHVQLSHIVWGHAWERLRGWIENDFDALQYATTVRKTAANWHANERDNAYLLRRAALQQAIQWAGNNHPTRLQTQFIEASLAEQQAQDRADTQRRRRNQSLHRQRQQVMALLVVIVALLIMTAISGASGQ